MNRPASTEWDEYMRQYARKNFVGLTDREQEAMRKPNCGPSVARLMQQLREKARERALPNVLPSRWKK